MIGQAAGSGALRREGMPMASHKFAIGDHVRLILELQSNYKPRIFIRFRECCLPRQTSGNIG